MKNNNTFKIGLIALLAVFTLSACERQALDLPRQKRTGELGRKNRSDVADSLFGEGGLDLSGSKTQAGAGTGGGIGVNSYLWRATLDTIAFLPVSSADPFGGVILTDWYSPPETPQERFKVNVYILGRTLRADGLRVSIFRQVLGVNGWQDAAVEEGAGRKLEDAVLTQARLLRNETRKLK
ncbi:MAG: hypothetical protein COB59_04260 [Rhodospirillaceae bacterium]|nr:MAG: hypothetical protein COB59_04260 [Rhodospirillaceae bacterium]